MAFLSSPLALKYGTGQRSFQPGTCSVSMKRMTNSSTEGPGPKESPADLSSTGARVPEDMLLEDIKRIRAKRKLETAIIEEDTSPLATVKSAFETILLWDFFLVVGLLGWLVVALIPHFAAHNDVLLDAWLGLWQPFIQPVLGILMLGTIAQGTVSFINKD